MTTDSTASTASGAPTAPAYDPVPDLARELGLPVAGVRAAVELLDEGSTVPFIARYRKERTGGLDEVQLRAIEERRAYRVELEQRRATIRDAIAGQGKLTPELAAAIAAADSKAALEDLYLPYKPKRQTRAQKARERGLEPLARRILDQPADGNPEAEAAAFVSPEREVGTTTDALAGARDIAAEVVAETAAVRAAVRAGFTAGAVVSAGVADKIQEPTKYEPYYDYREPVATIPSHRFLAVRRGEAEGVLRAHLEPDGGAPAMIGAIERLAGVNEASPWAALLREAVADAYQRLLAPAIENDVRAELKQRSDVAAVEVFADNLSHLLLAPPFGGRAVIGIDPGLRTGCKCAAVDATGRYLASLTVFLTQGEAQLERARAELGAFITQWNPAAIAVGNGTGGREAEGFVRKLLAANGLADKYVVSVNEAGASVYSASDLARAEFPDLDLTIRGAISIARRLQDPLAELVKVEPKAIGVGQYQHDVHQPLLARKLEAVVESCVNRVGVELNTASAQLLGYVAGIGKSLAGKIVVHRDQHGPFHSRKQLLDVSGLGPKAFEQCAGFLRVRGGEQPLDASAVHPERYALVEKMAADLGLEVGALIGNQAAIETIDLTKYVGEGVGEPTLRDIVGELGKPGRDPRAEFTPPKFRDDVTTLEDLKEGMVLEGVVTNVTAFGAFVDIGVHQDGLVHISRLSDRFVKDASELVKVGDRLTVRVIGVDLQRRRIALTARRDDAPRGGRGPRRGGEQPRRDG
ncbi:MAG TPA: Tex family protein, partial [Kofleriaceae bacterium]|nr:Tex family protein [Kofleriaceae bacterium]